MCILYMVSVIRSVVRSVYISGGSAGQVPMVAGEGIGQVPVVAGEGILGLQYALRLESLRGAKHMSDTLHQ